jgi:hypothetical protein
LTKIILVEDEYTGTMNHVKIKNNKALTVSQLNQIFIEINNPLFASFIFKLYDFKFTRFFQIKIFIPVQQILNMPHIVTTKELWREYPALTLSTGIIGALSLAIVPLYAVAMICVGIWLAFQI